MARDWVQKHQRLIYLMIGLICGLMVSGFVAKSYDVVLEESIKVSERTISAFKQTQEKQVSVIQTLRKENNKLKTKSSTYKVIHPDGKIEERTANESESESTISEESKQRYERTLQEMRVESEQRYNKTITEIRKSNHKLHLHGGVNTSLKYELGADYNVWNIFTIGGGMVPQVNQYSIHIGIKL